MNKFPTIHDPTANSRFALFATDSLGKSKLRVKSFPFPHSGTPRFCQGSPLSVDFEVSLDSDPPLLTTLAIRTRQGQVPYELATLRTRP